MTFELVAILRCPECGALGVDYRACGSCGSQFDQEDGTPLLFAQNPNFTFSVRYVTLEETRSTLENTFRRPSDAGASKIVYHLDQAHIPYFESLPDGAIVLEVGCGGGQMRNWVEAQGLHYCGTDVSKSRVLEVLREFGGPDFLSDAHNLPISDNSVDLVYSAAVTEHLSAPHRAMQEIFRVLKPGGIYLGNCSFMEPWHDESYFHISPNGAVALLLQAGFEPLAIWPSESYSGYKSLLNMDNRLTQIMRPLGIIMQAYSRMFYRFKRVVREADRYSETTQLKDFARTAGAIDWVARKPE